MIRKLIPIAVCLLTPLAILGCAQDTPQLTAEEDFDQTYEIYSKAETHEARVQPWFGFLERHPGSPEAMRVVRYLASSHYLEEESDPSAAVELVKEYMGHAESDSLAKEYERVLFDLAGETGIEPGLAAEDWEFVVAFGEELLDSLSPRQIRAEAGDRELTDAEVESRIRTEKENVYHRLGRALIRLGQSDEGMARYEEGSQYVELTAGGFSYSQFHEGWATALVDAGKFEAAKEIIAPKAVIAGEIGALGILREAYLGDGGAPGEFDAFVETTREKIARTAPSFAATDYSGKTHRFDGYGGEVTLLAFWFPT
jgi:hypothetical protein